MARPIKGPPRHHPQDVVVVDYDKYSMLHTATRAARARWVARRRCGSASTRSMRRASGFADAVVTAPIAKESWHLAGYKYPGHTELLAERTHAKQFAMMFAGGPIRVVLCDGARAAAGRVERAEHRRDLPADRTGAQSACRVVRHPQPAHRRLRPEPARRRERPASATRKNA